MHGQRKASPLRGFLLFALGGLVGANVTYFVMTRNAKPIAPVAPVVADDVVADDPRMQSTPPATAKALPVAVSDPDSNSDQHDAGPILPPPVASMRGIAPPSAITATTPGSDLLIPVQGIPASRLRDTFTDARSAGRSHDAIDIMAPAGTPVLAVADGRVEKLFTSKRGGLTIYEFNPDGTLAYYYAHLQRYADGLAEQQTIKRGQVLGYVGSTGNASPDAPHLHFAIFVLGPEKQWWKGEAVNPYPRLSQSDSTPN